MPFSLLIMAGPSTILTSATIASGICTAWPGGRRRAAGRLPSFMPAARLRHAGAAALTSRFFTSSSSSRECAVVADAHGEPLAAFDRHRDRLAAQGHLDHVLDVADLTP